MNTPRRLDHATLHLLGCLVREPLTAPELAERAGILAHDRLSTLATYGLVERTERRTRAGQPWRLTDRGYLAVRDGTGQIPPEAPTHAAPKRQRRTSPRPIRVVAGGTHADVVDSLARRPMTLAELRADTGRTLDLVRTSCARLADAGLAVEADGRWSATAAGRAALERVTAHPDLPTWLASGTLSARLLAALVDGGTLSGPALVERANVEAPTSVHTAMTRMRGLGWVTRQHYRHAGGRLAFWTITAAGCRALATVTP